MLIYNNFNMIFILDNFNIIFEIVNNMDKTTFNGFPYSFGLEVRNIKDYWNIFE